ncbi:MAG TPA: 30S ribosomal protein S12 methylthiotransferase RimO, partial [Deltaproteobacteria bacterium]|nr:30S ribosomal protein S12 methylthiotransferase RimO [Deltaproteobacteria bacterium]
GLLAAQGHELSDDGELTIVNTCAFITEATRESIDTILSEAGRKRDCGGRLVVTGCLYERYGDELKTLLPEVDLFLSNVGGEAEALLGLDKMSGSAESEGCVTTTTLVPAQSVGRKVLTRPPSAYLKIQEGCNNHCTYCTIPLIKGPLVSRPVPEIRDEFQSLLSSGFKEITMVGQDITSFGKDSGTDLKVLLAALLSGKEEFFLRLLYLHPQGIDDELLDLIASDDRIIKYMDIPLQHSEDRILKAMNRGYTRAQAENLLERIRDRMPDAVLRTTMIVGFPGETDGEFEALCSFVRSAQFDNLGAFVYSREDATPAHKLKGQVRKPVKQERHSRLMQIQQDISKERLKRLVGRKMQVVVEGPEGEGMIGRLLVQAPDVDGLAFIQGNCEAGQIREGEVVKTLDYDVIVRVGGTDGTDQ